MDAHVRSKHLENLSRTLQRWPGAAAGEVKRQLRSDLYPFYILECLVTILWDTRLVLIKVENQWLRVGHGKRL